MASKSVLSLLLSSLITSSFAFQDRKDLPETYCITYLSTYLVPISGVITDSSSEETSVILSPNVDDFLSTTLDTIIANPTDEADASDFEPLDPSQTLSLETSFSLPLDDPFSTSLNGGGIIVTASLPQDIDNLDPEPTADPTASAPGGGRSVVFRIVPNSDDTERIRRGIFGRDLGGMVGSPSDICSEAIVFSLSEGRLLHGGSSVYYNGESYKELGGQSGPVPGDAITTTFVDNGGYIQFVHTDLPNGRAGFCQVASSGQVYLTFGFAPPNCVPVRLAVMGVEECLDGASASATDTTSVRTRITGIVQDLTKSSGAPIPTSVDPILTGPTTIDIAVTENPPETRPFPTTSVRFSNTSTTIIRLPVAPTFSSILSFVPIDTSAEVSNLPTSLSDIAPIDSPSTQTTFPSEETPTSIVVDNPDDVTDSSVTDIIDEPTATTDGTLPDVSSTLQTNDAFVSETSTADSEPPTTILSVFPVTNLDTSTAFETITTTETSDGDGTDIIATETATGDVTLTETATKDPTTADTTMADTTTADTTSAEITTAPDTTTADTTTAIPTTTAEPIFERACPLAINGVNLFQENVYVDDQSRQLDSPFDISLFGESGRTLFVSANGQVTIGSNLGSATYYNRPLPQDGLAPMTIFTYWDDMDIDPALGHQITYEVVNTPQGQVLNIDWCVGTYPRTGGYNHWTLSLYERRPGFVKITYDSTVKKGSSATVGVQNRNQGFYKQFSHDTPNSVTDSTILEFFTYSDGHCNIYRYGF